MKEFYRLTSLLFFRIAKFIIIMGLGITWFSTPFSEIGEYFRQKFKN